jgi:hypothetical protein
MQIVALSQQLVEACALLDLHLTHGNSTQNRRFGNWARLSHPHVLPEARRQV